MQVQLVVQNLGGRCTAEVSMCFVASAGIAGLRSTYDYIRSGSMKESWCRHAWTEKADLFVPVCGEKLADR